ncbi:transmembrane emp24 domain-containing protein 7-like isoform X2 [Pomacea canaliculata]|uniref:transmembrane emp24 domain-containing protein 7-like isoform X2 n=1 Tax=Pomacea canaliculata TaxID=400727 RepID=UPI000D72811F|nr:transmembrane emp24 domain-containing protein 7-like isoform X2 [Pomacea canaliculata]
MHCRSCQWLVALVLLHFVLHVRAHASASRQVTYVLKRLENTCFAQVWTESQKVIFEYQVLRGGNKDVDVQIISPNGMILYEKQKSGRDEVTFIPSNGEFKFCFGNEFSQLSDKVVTFYIQPVRSDSLSEEAGERLPTVKQANEATCDNIHLALTRVADLQVSATWIAAKISNTRGNKSTCSGAAEQAGVVVVVVPVAGGRNMRRGPGSHHANFLY